MAMYAARAAAASVMRRRRMPALGSGLPHLGRMSGRPSLRASDVAWELFSEKVDTMSISELKSAKCLIDFKLEEAGVNFKTGQEAQFEKMEQLLTKNNQILEANTKAVEELRDRKGDFATVKIRKGKWGTANLLTVTMVLLKADDNGALSSMVMAAAETIRSYL